MTGFLNILQSTLAGLLGVAFCIHSAMAEEGGSGHYLPGSMASFMDGVAPDESFLLRYNLIYYDGAADLGQYIPIGGLETLNAEATSWVQGITAFWRPSWGGLSDKWSYAMSATVPYVWLDVEADVIVGDQTVRRSSSINGLGDIVIMPLMLNYNVDPDLNLNFRLGFYAPTGSYEEGRLANTGKNYWTVEPRIALMYFGQKNGREASIFAGLDFNGTNDATDYKTGTQFSLDGTLAQHFPLAGGLAGVGINFWWVQQIEGDSGSGASFGDFKGETHGLGPVVSFITKIRDHDMMAEVKWLHEFGTTNRLKGDTVWCKVIFKF